MAGFTDKMAAALSYYAKHASKVRAYRHAYNCGNMQPQTVRHEAWVLFEHPLMAEALNSMRAVTAQTTKIDSAWVLERAGRLANFNISTFVTVDEHGTAFYDFSMATDDDWYCISEYTVDVITKGTAQDKYEVERVKLKTHCKLRALELVGKHTDVQAFKETIEHTGVVGIANLSTEDYKAARAEMLADDDC